MDKLRASLLAAALSVSIAPGLPAAPGAAAHSAAYDDAATDARALLAQLIAADTSNPPGNEARAAAIGSARLKQAGRRGWEIECIAVTK